MLSARHAWRTNVRGTAREFEPSQRTRTHAVLLDALNRPRGKGQQKVTVEHVHVHEGGQAIVGNVESRGEVCVPRTPSLLIT
jgi:hypothetical protein